MRREKLEDGWPLVVRHYDAVVRFLEARPTAAARKASRRDVLRDYLKMRDIRAIAGKHDVSPSVIDSILARAIKVASDIERGRPPRAPRPRKAVTMTLTAFPTALLRDLDEWASLRGKSRREAAIELLKVALDVMSERRERQARAAPPIRRPHRKR